MRTNSRLCKGKRGKMDNKPGQLNKQKPIRATCLMLTDALLINAAAFEENLMELKGMNETSEHELREIIAQIVPTYHIPEHQKMKV